MDSLLEPVADTEKQQFCVEMMKRLDIQRRNEHLCDVILEVGSGDDQARLEAHRIVLCAASPFFYNALNSDMKEKKEGVIRLEDTSKVVMEDVLEFLYTGHVAIGGENAFELLGIADFLVLPSLKEASSKFISGTLSTLNCLMAYYSAVKSQCPELEKQASDFVFANFLSLAESQDFLNLSIEQVEEWISRDEIRVKGEEEVFQVIVKWMERRGNREGERFFELFRHVRVVYLSRNFVFNVLLRHPLVKNNEACTTFVLDAMREVSHGSEECFFAQPPRNSLKMHEDGLVICGQKEMFCYLPSENKWYELANISLEKTNSMRACHGKLYISGNSSTGHSTIERYDPVGNSWSPVKSYSGAMTCCRPTLVNFQGYLYVVGGFHVQKEASDKVHKYNPDTNIWQEVAPMSIARRGVCVVADTNFLYAIGGWSENEFLDAAERFDPERNTWKRIASTVEKKTRSCAVIVRGKVFLFGGYTSGTSSSSRIEMYDPTSDIWTVIESMGAPHLSLDAVTFDKNVFVLGVWHQDSSYRHSLQIYNVDNNEWRSTGVPRGAKKLVLSKLAPLRIPRGILNMCKVLSQG